MSDRGSLENLKQEIVENIYTNENQAVTGDLLQDVLIDAVDTMGVSVSQNSETGGVDIELSGQLYSAAGIEQVGIININKLPSYDYTSTFTLSSAIEAVPQDLRYAARGITYLDSNHNVHLAIFNSDSYASGWNNTSKWIVFDKEILYPSNNFTSVSSRGYLNFDNNNEKIVLSQPLYYNEKGVLKNIPAGTYNMDLSSTTANFCVLAIYNEQFEFRAINDVIEDDKIIATVVKGNANAISQVVSCVMPYKINDAANNNNYVVFSTRGYINFDNINGKIVLSEALYYDSKGILKNIPAGTYNMDLSSTDNYCALVVNSSDNFVFRSINEVLEGDKILASVVKQNGTSINKVVSCLIPFRINGEDQIINTIQEVIKVKADKGELYPYKNSVVNAYGDTAPSAGYQCSNFLLIDKTDKIIIHGSQASSMQICDFYDKDGNFIITYRQIVESAGGTMPTGNDVDVEIGVEEIPANAMYIRISSNMTSGGSVKNAGISLLYLMAFVKTQQNEINDLKVDITKQVKAAALESTWKSREQYLRTQYKAGTEPEHWYGVEWQEETANIVTPINSNGDSVLHVSLPIQSKMKRCVVKNGVVQYYLDDENSELKADGVTTSNLDGSDGNVMVEIPEFFYRFEEDTNNNTRTLRIKLSEQGLDGFQYSPKRYTSAYEATIDRTTSKLVSVCTTLFTRITEEIFTESDSYIVGTALSRGVNKTALRDGFTTYAANYRGGTNDNTLDTATDSTDTNFARNQLGIPISNINRTNARLLADSNNGEFIYQYDTHRILWMLSIVEFKSKNIQNVLGVGATVYPNYSSYEAFFTPQGGISCLPCGITNSLGNKSGVVYYKMQNVPVDSVMTRGDVWMPVISYRGVENYYGHIYKIADQLNILCLGTGTYATGYDGNPNYEYNDVEYSFEKNPYLTDDRMDKSLGVYRFISGTQVISSILGGYYGHVLPIDSKLSGYETEYCDCVEIYHKGGVVYPAFNGRIVSTILCGSNFIVGNNLADNGSPRPSDGTRLDIFM